MLNFQMKKSVYFYTYGCQMNVHDSEKMLGMLTEDGYQEAEKPDEADLIIFNTCAIREKAEQKFYSQLGRTRLLKEKHDNIRIAVVGCVAQDSKANLMKRAPYVDFVLGPQNIYKINSIISGSSPSMMCDDNPDIALQEYDARRQSTVRAWVSIMYGCNNYCSYCIVPYTRGREVSRPYHSIVSEIKNLKESGYKEVTLLGQNVNSYNSDVGFPDLLRKINETNISRIRFVTSHPRDLSGDLVSAMAELPGVCEHIHLPIQSGSDKILHRMNRGYSYQDYIEKIFMLRKKMPGIAITADIIAGFPGEDETDFSHTVNALREIEFDGIFAFRFSARKGTKAFGMGEQLPEEKKLERLNYLLSVQEDITHRKNKLLEGSYEEILIEGPSETDSKMLTGRTRSNKIVTIHDNGELPGSLLTVQIERARLHSLLGSCIVNR